jgi:hypothetical protein
MKEAGVLISRSKLHNTQSGRTWMCSPVLYSVIFESVTMYFLHFLSMR